MKIDKQCVVKDLQKSIDKILVNTDKQGKIYDICQEQYNIPKRLTSDFVCYRKSLDEASEFILFCIMDALNKSNISRISLDNYFTEIEINTYSKETYHVHEINFPIRVKMIQVDDDQWIGKTDVDFLIELRNAQLINYNINAQRTMKSIIKNGKSAYKITLNERAVESIKEHIEKNSFIPNTITLNIPQDEVSDFKFDETTSELVIYNIKHFDILDGYHRYIAICKAKDSNEDFNYNFELRIVNFTEDKSKSFIFQEDQKTKMKKVDSKSFDMNNAANIIVNRLNQDSLFNLQGQISRNDGQINYGMFADIIEYLYIKRGKKYASKNKMIIELEKELRSSINALTEYKDEYLTKQYKFIDLATMLYLFDKYTGSIETCERIHNVLTSDKLNLEKFKRNVSTSTAFKEIDRVDKEVNVYV